MTTEKNLLRTLERILAVEATELRPAMVAVCNLVAEAFGAEKVDVFFLEGDVLVAAGTSETPLGAKQKALGLDRLPVASGGRAVRVLESGRAFATQDSRSDPVERRALVEDLGIRSAIFAPLDGDTCRRGVLAIASPRVGAFEEARVEFARAVARWVSLVAHRADLADEIARRAREEGRRAAADELVTVLAHDFRNYLQPIAARFELIRRRAAREGRVRDRDDVDAALTSVRRLVRLVEDLLDIARLDAGLMELERKPLDLAALVRETAEALEVAGRPIRVQAPPRLPVEGDAARLRQVLDNLLANAAKHAPPGTQVDVRVDVEGPGPSAAVRISDRGPGVPPEVLPTLFQRFGRGRGSTGLGLGLYLAHEITQRHGGSLTVESDPGRGTTFTLALPAPPASA